MLSVVETGATTLPPLPRCPPSQQPLTAALWATAEGTSSVVQKNVKDIENFCNIFDLVVHVELRLKCATRGPCFLDQDCGGPRKAGAQVGGGGGGQGGRLSFL